MAVQRAGGPIYFEPAVVTWMTPPPLVWSDLPFFLWRLCASWNRSPLEHFGRKWALDWDERRVVQIEWRTDYRHAVLRLPVATKRLRRLCFWHLGGLAGRYIVVRAENAVTNLVAPDARASGSRRERTAG